MYNIHALFPPEPIGPPDLAERLGPILLHLRRAAADRAVKYWAYVPLGLLFAAYLSSVMRRVESLVARHRAGRLRARPHRARTVQPREERENAAPKRRLPARFGWVVEWLGHHAAGCAAQLRHMLTHDPDLVALLDAGPQAGRVLRPLCRMLGMEPGPDLPPSLFPPRRARPTQDRREAAAAQDKRVDPQVKLGDWQDVAHAELIDDGDTAPPAARPKPD